MKSLAAACLASLFLAAMPALAHAGKGHGHGHGHEHGKHWNKHAQKHWKNEHKHWAKHRRHFREETVVHHYYAPPRVIDRYYGYAEPVAVYTPPPGVHITMPDIYIPF